MSRRCGSVNVGGRPPAYFGYNESNPSSLKLWITSRTRSGDVNATPAICATSIPCADNNTICARRHVTTDPDDRRTILSNRLPSTLSISRTLNFSPIHRSQQISLPQVVDATPNVGCYGTSDRGRGWCHRGRRRARPMPPRRVLVDDRLAAGDGPLDEKPRRGVELPAAAC